MFMLKYAYKSGYCEPAHDSQSKNEHFTQLTFGFL